MRFLFSRRFSAKEDQSGNYHNRSGNLQNRQFFAIEQTPHHGYNRHKERHGRSKQRRRNPQQTVIQHHCKSGSENREETHETQSNEI